MVAWYWLLVAAAVGGLATSLFEKFKNYNLIDLSIDTLKSEAKKAEVKVIDEIKKL